MALNFPGPYQVRIYYETAGIEHVCNINMRKFSTNPPGELMSVYQTADANGNSQNVASAITTFTDGYRALFATATDFTRAELWEYPALSFDAIYMSTLELGVSGYVTPTLYQPAQQITFTYRTLAGGQMRIVAMEPAIVGNNQLSFPWGASLSTAITTFATSLRNPTSAVIARDDSRPVALIRASLGQNEALFRRRFRL